MSLTRMIPCQGWRYAAHGKAERVLRFEKFRLPFEQKSDKVVVKMLAAPVHKQDRNMIEGVYGLQPEQMPAIGGIEGCGVVEEVGDGARRGLKEGDFVWINNQKVGTWASHIVTGSENCDVLPLMPGFEIEFAASMSVFLTAYSLCHDYVKLQPGDVAMLTGATSAVTQVNCSLLRAKGVRPFVTINNGRNDHSKWIARSKMTGSFATVGYSYTRTNYMQRLLSDLPHPKLMLNHVHGMKAANLVKLMGPNATIVTYGNCTRRPIQLAATDIMTKNLTFEHFFLPHWMATHSREVRMRRMQRMIEMLTQQTGVPYFLAERFKMEQDAPFAFSQAWTMPFITRKPVLRMVGEYGEWREPRAEWQMLGASAALWNDAIEMMGEQQAISDSPDSMKYYTPFGDFDRDFADMPDEHRKEIGLRDLFFNRPNLQRHNEAATVNNKN